MGRRRCAGCGRWYSPNPKVAGQRYCSRLACQRARRLRWHNEKLATDEDYRLNQADAQRRWRQGHPDYWRSYRRSHPQYDQRNRQLQKERNRRRIAKMDALLPQGAAISGTYRLIPFQTQGIAKMDALIVKIDVVSKT